MFRIVRGVNQAKFVIDFIVISDIDFDFDPDFLTENGDTIIAKYYLEQELNWVFK